MNCPNCGQEFDGPRCPNCGRPVARAGNRIVAVIVVLFLALPLGLFGACSVVVAVSSSAGGFDLTNAAIFGAMALFGVAAAIGVLFWAGKFWRGE